MPHKRTRKNKDAPTLGRPTLFPGKDWTHPKTTILTPEGKALLARIAERLSDLHGHAVSESDANEDAIRARARQYGLTAEAT